MRTAARDALWRVDPDAADRHLYPSRDGEPMLVTKRPNAPATAVKPMSAADAGSALGGLLVSPSRQFSLRLSSLPKTDLDDVEALIGVLAHADPRVRRAAVKTADREFDLDLPFQAESTDAQRAEQVKEIRRILIGVKTGRLLPDPGAGSPP